MFKADIEVDADDEAGAEPEAEAAAEFGWLPDRRTVTVVFSAVAPDDATVVELGLRLSTGSSSPGGKGFSCLPF